MPEYKRIISLVPSLTELLIELGLKDRLVGRTRFCVHPEDEIEDVPIIGGTKNPRLDNILELDPDFILANKEENREEDIEILTKYTKVSVSDIGSVSEAIQEIRELGNQLEVKEAAEGLIDQISDLLSDIPETDYLETAYFIWKDPWMTIGRDTYIHDVMDLYGLKNIYGRQARYPKTSLDELAQKNPDLILLSSEPYPFKEEDMEEIRQKCPVAKIELVNGEWFSWYGSRMVTAFRHLNKWRTQLA